MELKPVLPGCQSHLRDESRLEGFADHIVFPENTEEAAEAVRTAAAEGRSLTVQGARTGIAGGAVPQGGIILCTERMKAPLDDGVDAQGRRVLRVQAGISFAELQSFLHRKIPEYRFPPNPTETSATLGGAFAVNAKGANSLRYGGTGGFAEGLSWITPCGEIWNIRRGGYCFDRGGCPLPDGSRLDIDAAIPRGASALLHPFAGLDLVDFLAGSEGLAGIASELTLRLGPVPANAWVVVYFFAQAGKAAGFAEALSRKHLSQAEYYDASTLDLIRRRSGEVTALRRLPPIGEEYREAVHVELEGDDAESLESALMEQLALFTESGGGENDTWAAADRAGLENFRLLRHAAPELINTEIDRIRQGLPLFRKTAADFAVPPEKAAAWNIRYHRDMEEAGLAGFVFGHILEGRLHVNLLAEDAERFRRALALLETWAEAVVEEGGLLAAENGVGRLRAPLISRFLSAPRLDQIRRILRRLDPQGLMDRQDKRIKSREEKEGARAGGHRC